jgi:hypothetical protein
MESIDLKKHMPERLIEAFGGEEIIRSFPWFEIDNSKMEMTQCLDFIKYNELTSPIMIGKDGYSRLFIVFKLQFKYNDKIKYFADIAFQRYTNENMWVSANTSGQSIMWVHSLDKLCENVKEIMANGCLKNVENRLCNATGDYILG